MVSRFRFVAVLWLVAQPSSGDSEIWVMRGRFVDERGKPVAGVRVADSWNANGIPPEQMGKYSKLVDEHSIAALWSHEGQMEPRGVQSSVSDADGHFAVTMLWNDICVLGIDRTTDRGALLVFNPTKRPDRMADLTLKPLVRLVGRLRIRGIKEAPSWSTTTVSVPDGRGSSFGNRLLAGCGSKDSRFEFRLPPGEYLVEASGDVGNRVYESRAPKRMKLAPSQAVVDLGVLELSSRTSEKGK